MTRLDIESVSSGEILPFTESDDDLLTDDFSKLFEARTTYELLGKEPATNDVSAANAITLLACLPVD